ncbi:MAG: SUMF1/EgtB/PvdO family nonheme iron enzyme [Anaerolineaceae bacterium]|nr:SUMF1/EgtB/PvdO family nonheme iron enzyme [Anaerolineaceae bacterium]
MSQPSLPEQISQHFNLEELRALCYELAINYENVRGETLEAKALALVEHCARHGLTERLLDLCRTQRPFLPWTTDQVTLASEAISQQYRQHLIARYQYLDFRGLGQAGRQPIRLPLEAVYVPLNGRLNRIPLPASEADTPPPPPVQPLLSLLQENAGLIVLGVPGAGKTTWLKYLALQLAHGHGAALGLGDRLPLVLSLSSYAAALAEKDVPLSHFLADFYQNLGFVQPLDGLIQSTLAQGKALLLLDGLDEVADPTLRHLLSNRLNDFFTIQQQLGNKFVITSRPAGYEAVRLMADGLLECTVVPLDQAQIEQFVQQWQAAIEQESGGDTAVPSPSRLLSLLAENKAVQELAALPLLLTILLLIQRQGVLLPQRRVALYDLYLRTLLHHWQIARSLDRPPASPLNVTAVLQILAPLALWMHETSPQRSLVKTALARRQLISQLAAAGQANPTQAADNFLQELQSVLGLLVTPGPDSIGFLHLTFQEYAAAMALARLADNSPTPLLAELKTRLQQPGWDEVVLLTLGIVALVEFRPEVAQALMQGLLDAAHPPEDAATVLLLGEAAIMMGDEVVSGGLKTAVAHALHQTATTAVLPASQRVQAGVLLGQIGDPRPAVLTVDEMPFCCVPGGPFWLGRTAEAALYEGLDKPYWISVFPVTQAQFAQFVAAGGYALPELWSEAATVDRWRPGEVQDWAQRGWRSGPQGYGRPFNLPNHPVVGITWYEALAFCRWLTQRWRQQQLLPEGWQVQLPTEVAWEKAARGGLHIPQRPLILPVAEAVRQADAAAVPLTDNPAPQRPYPGQTSLTPQTANVNDTAVATSSAVGSFPQVSPVGCQEMCGNVWEWTASRFRPYPYDASDGREAPDVKLFDQMVLRGGAYWSDTRAANSTFRARRSPNDQNSSYGFRLMLSIA